MSLEGKATVTENVRLLNAEICRDQQAASRTAVLAPNYFGFDTLPFRGGSTETFDVSLLSGITAVKD